MAEADQQTTAELMREKGEEVTIPKLKECFRKVDSNGDNLISFREFCLAIEELGIQWELDTAKKAFKTMDENGNKALDWYEFSHGIHLVNPSVKAFWHGIFNPETAAAKEEEVEQTEFSIPEMVEILGDKKSDWKKRNRVFSFLQEKIINISDEEFTAMLDALVEHLAFNVQERKSAVAREACLTVAVMSQHKPELLLPYVNQLYPGLFGAIRLKINIINESGKNAGRAIAKFVPDNDNHVLLDALIAGTTEKHNAVRARCFEYIDLILDHEWCQNRIKTQNDYWEKYRDILIQGTSDRDTEARKYVFQAILKLRDLKFTDKFEEIENLLPPSGKKAMNRADKSKNQKKGGKTKRKRLQRRKKV